MRIDEIITEGISPENIAKLNKLRDLGNNRLADQIRIQLGRINDWDAAAEEARDVINRQDRAKRMKQDDDPKSGAFVFKAKQPGNTSPASAGRGKYTQYKDGSDRRSTPEPKWEPTKSDGKGTGAKIAKALNPLKDLDSTDIGTVATSALSKASGKFKNKDLFKRQPSKRK